MEARRCVFCGSDRLRLNGYKKFAVKCEVCGAQGPVKMFREEAVVAWNNATVRKEAR